MPARANPGEIVTVTARLDSKHDTPTRSARLTLRGMERSSQRAEYPFLALEAVFGPQQLTPGPHELSARFQLPADGPPTHAGRFSRVAYELRVEVEIPWWRNLDRTFEVVVVPAPVEPPSGNAVYSSRRGDTAAELYAEMTLASTVIAPGRPIRGAVSFNNVGKGKRARVDAAFVGVEGLSSELETLQFGARIHDGVLVEGEPIPFAITLPQSAPTTLHARHTKMVWFFDLAVGEGWGKKPLLRVPIQVWPTTREGGSGRLAPVGKSRRAQLWASVASEVGFEYDPEGDRLRSKRLDVGVEVSTAPRSDGRAFLTARLSYPALRMGLSVASRGFLSALLTDGVPIDPDFDRAFFVTAREVPQAQALLRGFGEMFGGIDEVRMNDVELTISSSGSGIDRAALKRFLTIVARAHAILAKNLAAAPMPAALASREADLRALALRLGGVLFRPGASILRAEKLGHAVSLHFSPALEESVRVELARPPNASTKEPSKRADAALTALRERGHVEVRHDFIVLATSGGVPASLEPIDRDVEALATLALLLEGQGEGGPYR